MSLQEKILITGTGRCGTSFLMMLFTLLGLDTGYTRENYHIYLDPKNGSGLESNTAVLPQKIIKNPYFLINADDVVKRVKVKHMIVPIRDYEKSAESRVRLGNYRGGLWDATNKEEQIQVYYRMMSKYMYDMVKYDIPTIFLDFDRMVSSSQYLYEKLYPMLDRIDYETFHRVYEETNEKQRRNREEKIILN
jgi:hypothetical protein